MGKMMSAGLGSSVGLMPCGHAWSLTGRGVTNALAPKKKKKNILNKYKERVEELKQRKIDFNFSSYLPTGYSNC